MMMQRLRKYADGIDAMALRERAMFFGAVALVLMTLLQVFLLNPVWSRRTQLSTQIVLQEEETKAIQAQIQALVRPAVQDQDALNRDRLKSLREQMAQLDLQFEQQEQRFVAPEKIAGMLENMVGKNRKLQLISLRNLPGTGLTSPSGAPGVAGGPAQAGAPGGVGALAQAGGARAVFRHTVELSVGGSYFDLLEYLAALEQMPQRLFWDGFELSVVQYPHSVLKLTVYTLSLEKSWLTV
jgi:MSHA biogenesis protein MshJ